MLQLTAPHDLTGIAGSPKVNVRYDVHLQVLLNKQILDSNGQTNGHLNKTVSKTIFANIFVSKDFNFNFNFILPKVKTDYIRQAQVLNIDNLRLIIYL